MCLRKMWPVVLRPEEAASQLRDRRKANHAAATEAEEMTMLPLRISNGTRILAEGQDEYYALAIRDEVVEGVPMMTSVWEPTPAELAMLNAGGAVLLTICGTVHPPVMLTAQPAPDGKD